MGMGMSMSPQIWQQFVDLVFQDDLIKHKQNFHVIMDDTFIHLTAEEHMDDVMDLFKVLRKYGLKLSPHKCQFFKKKIVYMGLKFQIQGDKVFYTPLKDKCDAIRNLESPKTLKTKKSFYLSSFSPNLWRLLIPIYNLQKKAKKFKWTDEAEKVFNEIKKLLVSLPVLKAPTPDGLFRLESDTSREDVGGTLLQKQGDEWVVIGYHSKILPKSAKNFGVTELELTELLVNIHRFMQLLCNRYFEVLVDHKAIEYVVKSKTESPTTRLKTLLLKLSEYTIELKYQKGSEMHTSDALSQLHNFTDTPDDKDVIPLNFLQHITPNYIEHSYSHFVENLYIHKTKALDATPVKQKCDRPPKPKPEIPISKTRTLAAAGTSTTRPRQHPRSLNNEIVSQQMIVEINTEREKSERLTVAKLNALKQFNKQDHKSKLMTEKCSLLPLNSQQLTPVQTAIQRMSEKHPDFDSECPYNITLGRTSMVQLSAWQDYESHKLYIQQISVPLTVRNNVRVLLGKTEVVSLTLQPNKTSFTPRHTITGKGVAYVKPFDSKLPLRPIEIKSENNRCCIEVHNTSNTTLEFLHGQEMTYFDARSKGIVQTNNSKHFPIDQYLHDRMTPATLSPTPLAYEKPIHPTEMPHITTRTELSVDDTNKPTSDDKYPWLESDDIRRNMTDSEILRMKLNLKDSLTFLVSEMR